MHSAPQRPFVCLFTNDKPNDHKATNPPYLAARTLIEEDANNGPYGGEDPGGVDHHRRAQLLRVVVLQGATDATRVRSNGPDGEEDPRGRRPPWPYFNILR
eukprot:6890709-Pyramimonas_sp.AAC.1